MYLPPIEPFAAFGTQLGGWTVWTKTRATAVLSRVVTFAGLPAAEYALHFLFIGGATSLSTLRASPKSDHYQGYLRSHGVDRKAVPDMLADANAQPALQPGQGTEWAWMVEVHGK